MDNQLDNLLANNRQWAADMEARRPGIFAELSAQQSPDYLWIGCSDSRVPANQIAGLDPGEVFVHRNVANQVQQADLNCMSALQYAVEVLGVDHVIACGHYGCGGVQAGVLGGAPGITDYWIWDIKRLFRTNSDWLTRLDESDRLNAMAELNVMAQIGNLAATAIVQGAWDKGSTLTLHGWIYRLDDGLLHYVLPPISSENDLKEVEVAIGSVRDRYLGGPKRPADTRGRRSRRVF